MAPSPKQRLLRALDAMAAAPDSLGRLDAVRRVRDSAELLEHEAVRAARRDGASWSAIGALYGMSKQGAQQRFRGDGTTSAKADTSKVASPKAATSKGESPKEPSA